jgi:hypothetical protein
VSPTGLSGNELRALALRRILAMSGVGLKPQPHDLEALRACALEPEGLA